jgi:hypothetical protein
VKISCDSDRTGTAARFALSGLATLLLCMLGLGLSLCLFGTMLFSAAGVRDFLSFRVGAQLLGTPQLYDVPSSMAVQKTLVGVPMPASLTPGPRFLPLP